MENGIHFDLSQIAALCRRHRVRRLAVFGSILRSDFDPGRSDADFLAEFEPLPAAERIHSYLGLRNGLEALLPRPVDLIEAGAIRNPYILEEIARQQQVLYAA